MQKSQWIVVVVAGLLGACSTKSPPSAANSGGGADYCAVKTVLANHCTSCHGAQPIAGAPMSLASWNDLVAPAKTQRSLHVFQLMQTRVRDDARPMPQAPFPRLMADEMATIDSWVAGGAQAPVDPTCSAANGGNTAGNGGGSAGNGGAGAAGDTAAAGTGAGGSGGAGGAGAAGTGAAGSGAGGDWPADCDEHYKLLAHGASTPGDTTKFPVSGKGAEYYQCFYFKPPWGTDQVQAVAFRPIIDDTRVVHHWILYGNDSGNGGSDGQVGGTGCATGAFLAGWAPGNEPKSLPADVGLQIPTGASAMLGLQVHYNNTAGYTDSSDASGVEICVTHHPRTNTAAVHWLGNPLISLPPHQTTTVTGQCTPKATTPVHIVMQSPHMHKLGVHATLIINRKDGSKQTLQDAPFDFANQQQYQVPDVIINAGDTLTTTCQYNNTTDSTVTFGENTENEMCFNFVVAWPLDQLVSASGGLGGFFGGGGTGAGASGNACMQ